jgi:cephalosporin hydroxylase
MLNLIKTEIKELRKFLHRIYRSKKLNSQVIDEFHTLYYDSAVHKNTMWLGVEVWKLPQDLWVYQELIYELKPDLIIETGTAYGGSAYYMASIMDLINHGEILTIDIEEKKNRPAHKRITYLTASSTDEKTIEKIKKSTENKKTVLVILDSDHTEKHVTKEIGLYNRFVTKESYLIVEDSNINGHPVWPEYGPGPMESIMKFIGKNKDFKIDESKEKFFMTWNPKGFLKKIR